MKPIQLPRDEAERLSSLHAHAIMDTAADPYLDSLTRMTAGKLHVPIVLVNLLDSDRQWAKSAFGLPRGYEVPRDLAFCSQTILTPDHVTIIRDATLDTRFADNPFVTGKPRFRFYAGVSIIDGEGRALGALCVIDTAPRDFTAADSIILSEMAESVSARLELYHSNAALRESKEHYRVAVASNPHMRWTMSADGKSEEGEERWQEMIGSSYEYSNSQDWVRAVHPEDLSSALTAWSASLREGEPLDMEYRLRLAAGNYRWFRVRATPRRDVTGRIMRWYGVVEDIHERKIAEATHLETETRLRLALDVGRLRTWELDLASRRLTASDVSVINFGLQLGAAVSDYDTALARMHPDDEQRYGREVEQAWAAGQDLEIEYRSIWPDGTIHWIRINGRPTKDIAGKAVRLVGLSLDITVERTAEEERQRAEARISYLARHDPLTGLANRLLFHQRLSEAMASVMPGVRVALLRIDLDDFKAVNVAIGHAAGDKVLQHAADRLKASVGEEGMVARYGSDEFAVILGNVNSPEQVDLLSRRVLQSLGEPIDVGETDVVLGGSIGISMAPDDATSPEQLLRNADTALHRAKLTSRGGCQYFDQAMDIHLQVLVELKLDLRDALSRNEFRLFYQPLIDLETGMVISFEALIRWQHPVRGLVSPADFIPLAEETGWIVPIGRWALQEACREAAGWPGTVGVAVNLSAVQFGNKDLEAEISMALSESGLAATRLELEVTETLLLQDNEANVKLLRALRQTGVRIAMDDFGTGYSSLGYLRRFPFDKIKIDQSLIRDLPDGAGGDAIVQAIIALANSLGISVTAEGVETQAQRDFLSRNGCGQVQGYLFSRPVPANDVPALLAETQKPLRPRDEAETLAHIV
ncbi:sensor domain-containing phosphodiesterase [Acidisoma cladoniae]|uniref:sensor domain-containing phosphodiesterase n=1 Tax=Acidisoma cladoniae TaxID=3040935 RepID=UPI002551B2B7|nr:EAL domain-containing protein [Acidisoma sp. PAMC 29798]